MVALKGMGPGGDGPMIDDVLRAAGMFTMEAPRRSRQSIVKTRLSSGGYGVLNPSSIVLF